MPWVSSSAAALAGIGGALALEGILEGEMCQGHGEVILPLVPVFMTAVGLLAALGPARRAPRMHPAEPCEGE